ncbi:hypothetical protein MKX03_027189 [Papaver bracteatum]|nr:hypothetical protein MKX03_027189 [Papaver bracteatum]
MAKALHHLSFFSSFFVGFLLVLFVSDMACVHSQSCYPQGSIELEPNKNCVVNECYDFICVRTGVWYDSAACGWNPETGNNVCICCLKG